MHLAVVSLELVAFFTLLSLFLAGQSRGSISAYRLRFRLQRCWPSAGTALRREKLWNGPTRRFMKLIPEIRSGEAPIESFSSIGGRLAPLASELAELCRDLGRQCAELATMEANLRLQVANRTNALERTIGSLKRQASRDALTGLYNRRALDEHLPQAFERCHEAKNDLCLLMIDVDYFKQLNDTLGHPAGDDLLRNIGQIIRSTVRETDIPFRYGGDEFVVVMEGQSHQFGQILSDRLRSLVDALARTIKVQPSPRLSVGIATLKELHTQNVEALLAAADQSLYEIKKSRPVPSRGVQKTKSDPKAAARN